LYSTFTILVIRPKGPFLVSFTINLPAIYFFLYNFVLFRSEIWIYWKSAGWGLMPKAYHLQLFSTLQLLVLIIIAFAVFFILMFIKDYEGLWIKSICRQFKRKSGRKRKLFIWVNKKQYVANCFSESNYLVVCCFGTLVKVSWFVNDGLLDGTLFFISVKLYFKRN
jgi:hypothetical protein